MYDVFYDGWIDPWVIAETIKISFDRGHTDLCHTILKQCSAVESITAQPLRLSIEPMIDIFLLI